MVELILDGADITCTVAPAILFRNVYECDGGWNTETAQPTVDTADAGANLILAENSWSTVSGSYVAKIYKDAEGEKKLWKQDGAVYSYMSMNVYGPGALGITAENEGLNSELHLTINGGDIAIRSQDDGINTNEDGVSVTTVNGGTLHIIAGLGAEGDGIDSNGYLVINGGTVVASANPASDAGLDSDMGSFINGGTVGRPRLHHGLGGKRLQSGHHEPAIFPVPVQRQRHCGHEGRRYGDFRLRPQRG